MLTLAVPITLACGEDDFTPGAIPPPNNNQMPRPPPSFTTVTFEHRASTDFGSGHPQGSCEAVTGGAHMHPEWTDYVITPLFKEGETLWRRTLTEVPTGRHRFHVHDANYCGDNRLGLVLSATVYANGVLLTQTVPTDRSNEGFAFFVNEDGVVSP